MLRTRPLRGVTTLATFLVLLAPVALAGSDAQPTAAEQVQQLEHGCQESADQREKRHAETPLYTRLGGYEKILDLTREIVRLHNENEAIAGMFVHVDGDALARSVADFMAAGTGGTETYKGRDMVSAHEHLRLTNADFLAAGGDIVKAMKTKGYGDTEIDEVMCILVSLRGQVVPE